MKGGELYGQVRRAVYVEGLSRREAARRFAIDPRRAAKMPAFSGCIFSTGPCCVNFGDAGEKSAAQVFWQEKFRNVALDARRAGRVTSLVCFRPWSREESSELTNVGALKVVKTLQQRQAAT